MTIKVNRDKDGFYSYYHLRNERAENHCTTKLTTQEDNRSPGTEYTRS